MGTLECYKELNEVLLKLMLCPVCSELLKQPIMICSNGHNRCAWCSTKEPRCCDAQPAKFRNLLLEEIVAVLLVPCTYAVAGCDAVVKHAELIEHVISCEFAHKCQADKCTWIGMKDDLRLHFNEVHGDTIVVPNVKVSITQLKDGICGQHRCRYSSPLFCLGEWFWVCTDVKYSSVRMYVRYIGPMLDASKFQYSITVSSIDEVTSLVYKGKTIGETEEIQCAGLYIARGWLATFDYAVWDVVPHP